MRKNIMKATTLLLAAAMTMSLFVGCGKEEPKTESIVEDSKTQEDASNNVKTEATENNKDASKEEDSQEVNPFLGPNGLMFASEDDVVINISGVDVPMTLTRDELIALIEENNWEIEYRFTDSDIIEGFITPDGDVYAEVLKIESYGYEEQLWMMDFSPDSFDLSKVSINGVSLDKVETLKNSSNLIEEQDTGYFMISIADYTTLSVLYNSRIGELEHIIIERARVRE